MGSARDHERTGGQDFHVGDVHVWAAIYYLDSTTDYREYLKGNVPPQGKSRGEPLILLDDFSSRSFFDRVRAFRLRQRRV
jgi:hypothetical protein